MNKKSSKIKQIILLQLAVVIYTFAGVMAKFASAHKDNILLLVVFMGLEVMILGVYAIFWQQLIKHFDLTVAYANRAMAILWSLVWASLFFKEKITVQNLIGVGIVLVGIFIMNGEKEEEKHV